MLQQTSVRQRVPCASRSRLQEVGPAPFGRGAVGRPGPRPRAGRGHPSVPPGAVSRQGRTRLLESLGLLGALGARAQTQALVPKSGSGAKARSCWRGGSCHCGLRARLGELTRVVCCAALSGAHPLLVLVFKERSSTSSFRELTC